MVTVIAKIRARPGREDEVRQELLKLVEPTRAEDGCLNYDLHVSDSDPCVFVFYENWTSREALDRHAKSPHLKAWGDKQPDMLAHGVEVNLYEMLTEAPWLKD